MYEQMRKMRRTLEILFPLMLYKSQMIKAFTRDIYKSIISNLYGRSSVKGRGKIVKWGRGGGLEGH